MAGRAGIARLDFYLRNLNVKKKSLKKIKYFTGSLTWNFPVVYVRILDVILHVTRRVVGRGRVIYSVLTLNNYRKTVCLSCYGCVGRNPGTTKKGHSGPRSGATVVRFVRADGRERYIGRRRASARTFFATEPATRVRRFKCRKSRLTSRRRPRFDSDRYKRRNLSDDARARWTDMNNSSAEYDVMKYVFSRVVILLYRRRPSDRTRLKKRKFSIIIRMERERV